MADKPILLVDKSYLYFKDLKDDLERTYKAVEEKVKKHDLEYLDDELKALHEAVQKINRSYIKLSFEKK